MSQYDNPSLDNNRRLKQHTRRPHRKTRTGCLTCKKRKIKCDEVKPECGNCIKHSLNCEYAPVQPTFDIQSAAINANGLPDLNLIDLELLHHFCASTALTLHDDPTIRTVWHTNVPKLGFQYDYVMHGILAFSALHLAYCFPDRKNSRLTTARLHHHAGLQKGTPALASFSPESTTAIYIFSALTTLYTFATTRNSRDAIINTDEGVAEWIVLSRQSFGIVRIAQESLSKGPIGQIFKVGKRRVALQDNARVEGQRADQLQNLETWIKETVGDEGTKHAYLDAMDHLRKCYAVVGSLPPESLEASDVFSWPYRISEDFLDLLKEPRQEALVILAFFAVLTKTLNGRWYLEGFGDHLMSRIYRSIDEAHKSWLSWPIAEMDWKPEKGYSTTSQFDTPMAE